MAIVRILTTEVGAQERVLPLGEASIGLGRADDNDVVLLEQAASRHHARIEPVQGGYEIVDLESSAGLTLRGEKVQRHRLVDGDELVIGGTRLRFVAHPGSQATVLPATSVKPSSQATQGAIPAPPNPFSDADTILPTEVPLGASKTDPALADTGPNKTLGGGETVVPEPEPAAPALPAPATIHAEHQPAPPPGAAPATMHAAHEPNPPAPTPAPAPAPAPVIEPIVPSDPPPKSSPSFVMGGDGASSPSNYTLDGGGSPGAAASGYSLEGDRGNAAASGYSLEGDRGGGMGGLSLDTMPPTALASSGPGIGGLALFAFVGAAASFGILVALQGVPW
ncbi:MAG: FHA domain-containing protein [Nannocystales bacterium]